MAHLTKHKPTLTKRIRRIGGQVAALERTLAGDVECGAVLQQIAAIRGAINGLMREVLEAHLREHVSAKNRTSAELDPVIAVLKSYFK
jgi:DNA-binding FrmR family transcriptional regulator